MKIGVISDTHAKDLVDLPVRIPEALRDVDLIIHAGDYTTINLLDQLRYLGNFKGVHGNMDTKELRRELPAKEILEIEGFRIGITHPAEGGSPIGLEKRVGAEFGTDLDLIIYGHTHKPVNKRIGNVIYFNPGSATGVFPARYRTYGILRIEDEIEGELIIL